MEKATEQNESLLNNENPKPPQKPERKKISEEEFLSFADDEEKKFKQETSQEIYNLTHYLNLDVDSFEKIKKEEGIDLDINELIALEKEAYEIMESFTLELLRGISEKNVKNADDLVKIMQKFNIKSSKYWNHSVGPILERLSSVSDLKKIKVSFKSKFSARFRANASYDPIFHSININAEFLEQSSLYEINRVLTHELIHSVFRGADAAAGVNVLFKGLDKKNIENIMPIRMQFENLYRHVLSNIDKNKKLDREHYGLKNVGEFIAESYTNPEFIELLSTIKISKQRTALDKAIDIFRGAITVTAKDFRDLSKEDKTALEIFKSIDENSIDLWKEFDSRLLLQNQG